jgi:hypothetical protein
MSKHTPGPWAVDADAYPIFIYSESETWPLIDELGNEEGCKGAFIANTGDNKANARLIAAAPELLEALKDMLDGHEDACTGYGEGAADKARAAIAKATGGEI